MACVRRDDQYYCRRDIRWRDDVYRFSYSHDQYLQYQQRNETGAIQCNIIRQTQKEQKVLLKNKGVQK